MNSEFGSCLKENMAFSSQWRESNCYLFWESNEPLEHTLYADHDYIFVFTTVFLRHSTNIHQVHIQGRSQWPRGRKHVFSSLAGTLRSWVRITLKAWMFGTCVYSVFVLSCVGSGLTAGRSLLQGVELQGYWWMNEWTYPEEQNYIINFKIIKTAVFFYVTRCSLVDEYQYIAER
jgi:hypothetical protein